MVNHVALYFCNMHCFSQIFRAKTAFGKQLFVIASLHVPCMELAAILLFQLNSLYMENKNSVDHSAAHFQMYAICSNKVNK